MAPLRSHLSCLLESEKCERKISFWYGARSARDLFYDEYFKKMEKENDNFRFFVALSEPEENDDYPQGYIHQHLFDKYLKVHPDLGSLEFYLCGPPPMLKAGLEMLDLLGVKKEQIAFDDFS